MQTENLNVDDLIIEYMITKLENGYNPYFSNLEFLDFLKHMILIKYLKNFLNENIMNGLQFKIQ